MNFLRSRPQYLLFAGVLAVYFAFLTCTYYWDGVLFSLNIESVHQGRIPFSALFHPNHLFYNSFGYAVYSAASVLWSGIRAITVLQIGNTILSACSGYVLFLIARRITASKATGLFGWLLFAAGATWWKFSTDADTYIVAVFLLLLSALFFLEGRIWPAAMCHTAAMLFHELAVFSYIPVLATLLLNRAQPLPKRVATCLAYCATTGAIVAGTYIYCYLLLTNTPNSTGFISWITGYAQDTNFTRSVSDIVSHYLTSYVKLFAGGKVSLILQFFGVAEALAFVACLALLIWGVRLLKQTGSTSASKIDRKAMTFLWAWFFGYALFLAAFDPGSAFHKLFVWPVMVLLIGIYVRNHARAATLFAGALAAWNFGAFIFPHSHDSADPVLVFAEKVNRELPKNATVYYAALDPDDWYLEYFAPGRQWKRLADDDDLTGGCFETTALSRFTDGSLRINPKMKWDLVNSAHNIRLECLQKTP